MNSIETSFGKANKKYKPGCAFVPLPLDLETKSVRELSITELQKRIKETKDESTSDKRDKE